MKTLVLNIVLAMLVLQVMGQCGSIDFSAQKTSGCKNDVIRFYTSGIPSGSVLSWYVDNKFYSSQDTLVHFFQDTGTYDVELKVTLPDSTKCQVKKTDYIRITQPLIKNVSVDKHLICDSSETVTFTASGQNVEVWNWIVDNNNYLDQGNVLSLSFSSIGTKDIHIIAYDKHGCLNQFHQDSMVEVAVQPVVNFTDSNHIGCKPLQVSFRPDIDSFGYKIKDYQWVFNEGSPKASFSAYPGMVLYNQEGEHDVTLSVQLENGCIASLTKTGLIQVGDSAVLDIASNKTDICKEDVVQFYNKSKVASPSHLIWSFYGGSLQSGSSKDTMFVKYSNSGEYAVKLTYDYNGCKTTRKFLDYIDVLTLQADMFVLNPNNCAPPHAVSFQSTSDLPSTGSTWFTWRFYDTDGVTQLASNNLPNPSYKYSNYGSYAVSLTLRHTPRGCVDSIYRSSRVNIKPLKEGMLKMQDYQACVNNIVKFSVPTELLTYSMYPLMYDWTFYDYDDKSVKKISKDQYPEVVYDTGSMYDYKLVLDNGNGCRDSVYFDDKVNIIEVNAEFDPLSLQNCVGDYVKFGESTTPSGSHTNYWYFTNTEKTSVQLSETSVDSLTDVRFTYPGLYDARLITVHKGCSDTLEKSELVEISGVLADIQVKDNVICPGDSTELSSSIVLSRNYTSGPDTILYEWQVNPASGVSISNPYGESTFVSFQNAGCYEIILYVTNGSGCTNEIRKVSGVCVGPRADFSMPAEACRQSSVKLVDKSVRSTSVEWYASSNDIHFLPDNQSSDPAIVVEKPGDYEIKLLSKRTGCVDSISKNLHVQEIISDFISFDSISYCAPVLVQFHVPESDATTYEWLFENDIVSSTKDTQISHYYLSNTGGADTGSTVRLIARSSIGCADTSSKESYIKVIGPAPEFTIDINRGCEPLQVRFKSKLDQANDYLFLFGDGQYSSPKQYTSHEYVLDNFSQSKYEFVPQLIAIDTLGCNVVFSKDTITVYKSPVANFEASRVAGCTPMKTDFANKTTYYQKVDWDFNNDGVIDDTTEFPVWQYSRGTYTVGLYAENEHGCRDSLFINNLIKVFDYPVLDFEASDSIDCLTNAITFTPIVKSQDAPLINYFWTFGDSLGIDTSTETTPSYYYAQSGYYDVLLIAGDEYGCNDTVIKKSYVFIGDTQLLNVPGISFVSVRNEKDVEVNWRKYDKPDFKSYKVYLVDSPTNNLIYSTGNPEDTSFVHDFGLDVNNESYQYLVNVVNICDAESESTNIHNTVLLSSESDAHGVTKLNWNEYKGWNLVNDYLIYRKSEDETTFKQIASIPSTQLWYTDQGLCNINYEYYVLANSTISGIYSSSNNVALMPEYELPDSVIRKRSTLVDNKGILTEWIDKDKAVKDHYIIDRYDDENGWIYHYAEVTSSYYMDENIQPDKVYLYQVSSVDQCGNEDITPSKITKNIVLNAALNADEQIQLTWSSYPAVKPQMTYQIEIRNQDNSFGIVGNQQPGLLSYTDENDYANTNQKFCYRIKAIFEDESEYESVSNESCIIFPSRIYIPNAFTPNGDGLNDVFSIESMSLMEMTGQDEMDYEMKIFDRWGTKVFESKDISTGWDGSLKGGQAPDGIYVYSIFAKGLDGTRFKLKGTITLLR